MSCDPFEWTCARCGKTYPHPFFRSYPREFWKDNKKRVGDVCERCRNEVDDENARRRKGRRGPDDRTMAKRSRRQVGCGSPIANRRS